MTTATSTSSFPRAAHAPSACAHSGDRDCHGFTIIELVVACFILIIVLALVTRTLLAGISNTDRVLGHQTTISFAQAAIERLGSDVRRARARDRDLTHIEDTYKLRAAMLFGSTISIPQPDFQDIVIATGDRLVLQSDVNQDAPGSYNPECVTWEAITTGAVPSITWLVRRTVRTYTSHCATPGTLIAQEDIVPATTMTTDPPPLFPNYVLFGNPATITNPNQIDPDLCVNWTTSNPSTALQRAQISSVTIDMRSIAQRRNASAKIQLADTFNIRTRSTHDYMFALGCSM